MALYIFSLHQLPVLILHLQKHYLQVTDEHFQKATQNPTQTVHDKGVSDGQQKQEPSQLSGKDTYGNAGQLLNIYPVGDTGFEPVTSAV